MSKFFNQSIALVLALVLALAMFAGCSQDNKGAEEKKPEEKTGSAEQTQAAPKEKMKISWATWVMGPVDKDSYAEQELEKAFPNVDIDFWAFERGTWQDQINTRVAGGDIPDIIYRDALSFVINYVKQGILAEIPYHLVKQNAPGIYKASQSYGKEVWLACYYDGKNYGLPIMQPDQTRPFTNAWRKDYLDKLGITKVPETLEEAEEAFKKFVNEDPDGNGAKDTYGMTFRGKDLSAFLFAHIFSAFGVLPGQWMKQADGSVKYGITTAEAREALALLNKWYKAGYIDPEFVTTDNAIYKQKLANGKVGYVTFGTWYRFIPGGEYYDDLKTVNPSGEYVMGPALKGPQGKYGYMNWGTITSSLCFGKHLAKEPEKLARAMQVIERVMVDAELYGKVKLGKEGEHWKRNAENNGAEPIPPYNDAKQTGPIGKNFFGSIVAIPSVQDAFARKDGPDLYKYAIDGNVKNNRDYFTWIGLFINPDVVKDAQGAAPLAAKWAIDFITGAQPLDKFDQFVKEWEAAGGAALTKDANEAFKKGQDQIDAIVSKIN